MATVQSVVEHYIPHIEDALECTEEEARELIRKLLKEPQLIINLLEDCGFGK